MKILITPRARRDLRQIHTYLQQKSAQGSENVMRRIREAFLRLRDRPEIGMAVEDTDVRRLFIGKYPYIAYYRLKSGSIEVIHVRHTSRMPVEKTGFGPDA